MRAEGEFEVDLQPMDPFSPGKAGVRLARFSISKFFHGDLTAHSLGEMLSAMTGVEGSAGYVAIEQVDGRLHGKAGTFVLQHYGRLARGEQSLVLEVVPDSGTDQLENLAGSMTIRIADGKHFYEFDYTLP